MKQGQQRRLAGVAAALAVIVALAVMSAASNAADGGNAMGFIAKMEFGKDIGQSFGSLFEVQTTDGRFVIGAGFADVCNTNLRSDRYVVQFFIRPTNGEREFSIERLPRPNNVAGAYMFDYDGKLYAYTYQGDTPFRRWDEATQAWVGERPPSDGVMHLGDGLLALTGTAKYNGEPIIEPPERGSYYRFYYAQGYLCFYHTYKPQEQGYTAYKTDDEGFTKLYACPWLPESGGPVDLTKATVLTLPFIGETPFTYGQLGTDVVTCSNIGGLYVFDGSAWRTLVEPDMKTSYQIYSMINLYDKLLMGHYPTGELIQFDGQEVKLLEGWPPRIEGVRPNAREAQTTAIYGGDLFVGVWPWGELWRYNRDADHWYSAGRMFTHPEVTDQATHPYEEGCIEHKLVQNQWGQRVTSLVPIGDSLMISTSAKWPCEWKPEFEFLPDGKWQEYGTVLRLRMPGSLSVPIQRKDGPTELQFMISGDEMRILQDGTQVGTAELSASLAEDIGKAALGEVTQGHGVFGTFGGSALDVTTQK